MRVRAFETVTWRRFLGSLSSLGLRLLIGAWLVIGADSALAAITYFDSTSNPADGNNLDSSPLTVVPPGSMLAGDLVILVANTAKDGLALMRISATGGQTWTSLAANTTNASSRIFWARYSGTWSANPSVTFPGGAKQTTVVMHVFRPSSGAHSWALDVAQTNSSFAAPSASDHDVTIGGITTVTDGALVFAVWASTDSNAWALQTGGWANAGGAQYRNGQDTGASQSAAYKIMPTAGASGDVTNRQTANGGDDGNATILAFKEVFCFTDDFNRANGAPAGNWVVANEGGAFGNPKIVGNRLRLTDATAAVSTMAALQQLFPAAGNKIVVEFDHFAYNGSGADGIAVVLSDAAVAPVPGAFGGSLGYAPKQASQGGDTTHYGFAGGWIGLAIDEYGNFSANTEGRHGGTAPGRQIDSVAIRGSGSGYGGYPYHRGTATLSPAIDAAGSTPAPGYRYRITIDHTNGVNAWTSVERNSGSGYAVLIAPYDAKAEAGQAAVPGNWFLSFTGSTGGSTNIHEIDNLQVCSANPQPLPTLDHVRILHDGSALTCAAESVTLQACADASCSTSYGGLVTVDLAPIAGATWSLDPVSFSGGQTSVQLSNAAAGTVTLGGTVTSPLITNSAASCYIGGTPNCSLTYALSSACFDVVEVGKAVSTPIYTKLAATPFNLDVISLSGSGQTATAVALVDASSGTCSEHAVLQSTSTTLPSAFSANQRKTFSFTHNNARPNVRARVTTAGGTACSSDNFVIRPQVFALSSSTPLNPATNTLAAGADFNLTANSGVVGGYTGTPTVVAEKINDHNANPIAAGTLAGSFLAATADIGAGTFQYHDVGQITLTADAVIDSNFAAVDQVSGTVGSVNHGSGGDCVANSTGNVLDATGLFYGCTVGSGTLGPLGRFIPDHFIMTAASVGTRSAAACVPASAFTYMDEPMQLTFTLTAQSAAPTNRTTRNYVGAYAKLDPTDLLLWPDGKLGASPSLAVGAIDSVAPTPLSARMNVTAVTASGWAVVGNEGSNTIAATARLARGAAPDGAYGSVKLGIAARDSDGVGFTSYDLDANNDAVNERLQIGAATVFRAGRLRLLNAYGSELLPLRVPLRAEYFTGTGWALNTADSCTNLAANVFALSGGIAANTSASAVALNAGNGTLILATPNVAGQVDVAANLGATGTANDVSCNTTNPASTAGNLPWLQFPWCPGRLDPNARIKFGSPKAPYIYLRERY